MKITFIETIINHFDDKHNYLLIGREGTSETIRCQAINCLLMKPFKMFVSEYTQILRRYIDFGQFFGLAPLYNLPFSSNFNISMVKFAVSMVYLVMQIGHGVFHVMKMYNDIRLTTMSKIIHLVWVFNCLLTNISVTVHSLLAANNLVAYINELGNIDQEIHSKLQSDANYQLQRRKHLLMMVSVLVMSFILSWTFYGCVAFFHSQLIPSFAFIFIPNGFMSIRVLQIIGSIELLNDHLDVINSRLKNIDQIHEDKQEKTLFALRHLYGRCWNAMQLFNAYFGYSSLLLLLSYSYDVLHGMYVLFLKLHGLRPDLAVVYGISFLPSAVNLFVITNAAERCRNKAKQTGVCLGDISSLPWCHITLKRFSVQVIQEPFLMPVCGLFVVNFKSLGGIVVGFSNLLLLFLQFEISENKLN